MQTTTPKRPTANGTGPARRSRVLSTRRGTTLTAFVTAIAAAALLAVYLQSYGGSVDGAGRPASVLVAGDLIEKGTTGEAIAENSLVSRKQLPKGDVEDDALTDPSALRGKVTNEDILQDQQLTTDSLGDPGNAVSAKLSDFQRAISVPLDPSHGMIGDARKGDKVDVLAGFNTTKNGASASPVLRALVRDALVLAIPSKRPDGAGTSSSEGLPVVLRVTDKQAQAIAFAADNGKVWIVLRPPSRSRQSRLSAVTLSSLLAGLPPLEVTSGGGLDEKGTGR